MKQANCDKGFCGVEETVRIIGRKWTLLILRELFDGTKRFNELQRGLPGVSPRTLSQRLQQMEGDGIVDKKIFPEVPPHVEYNLTDKGRTSSRIICDMREWGERSQVKEEAREAVSV